MLPKSLHTVRILELVAANERGSEPVDALAAVLVAAAIIGYSDASEFDPLIIKATANLAKGRA